MGEHDEQPTLSTLNQILKECYQKPLEEYLGHPTEWFKLMPIHDDEFLEENEVVVEAVSATMYESALDEIETLKKLLEEKEDELSALLLEGSSKDSDTITISKAHYDSLMLECTTMKNQIAKLVSDLHSTRMMLSLEQQKQHQYKIQQYPPLPGYGGNYGGTYGNTQQQQITAFLQSQKPAPIPKKKRRFGR